MKCLIICSAMSMSAITPSRSGPDRLDAVGGLAHHELGVVADCLDTLDAVQRLDRDHRGLVQDDTPTAHIDDAVLAVPRSMAMSCEVNLNKRVKNDMECPVLAWRGRVPDERTRMGCPLALFSAIFIKKWRIGGSQMPLAWSSRI